MGVNERVTAAVKAVGREGEVLHNGGKDRLFMSIQPVFPNGADPAVETGIGDGMRYRMYAESREDVAVSQGDRIICGGEAFEVLKSEVIRMNGEAAYIKALLCRAWEQEAGQ